MTEPDEPKRRPARTRPAPGRWGRFRALPLADRGWLLHAVLYAWAIRLALAHLPLRTTGRVLSGLGRSLHLPAGPDTIARARQATARAGGIVPGAGNCFVQALTLQTLLAHRRVGSEVRVGFVATPAGTKEGHAWVEHEGRVLMGMIDGLDEYRRHSTCY